LEKFPLPILFLLKDPPKARQAGKRGGIKGGGKLKIINIFCN
jgi:hypothetical protein